jgi:hypothetical protein
VNAPQPLARPDALVGEALGRLAGVSLRAGHQEWIPPLVPVSSERLRQAFDYTRLDDVQPLVIALLLAA